MPPRIKRKNSHILHFSKEIFYSNLCKKKVFVVTHNRNEIIGPNQHEIFLMRTIILKNIVVSLCQDFYIRSSCIRPIIHIESNYKADKCEYDEI